MYKAMVRDLGMRLLFQRQIQILLSFRDTKDIKMSIKAVWSGKINLALAKRTEKRNEI